MTTEGLISPFTKKQKGWGQELWPGLRQELGPEEVYKFWQEQSPYELYMMQLYDYIFKKTRDTDEFGALLTPEWNLDTKQGYEKVENLLNRAKTAISLGYPVEALPFYEEISLEVGPNFQRAYQQHLQEEMDITAQEQEELQATKQKLLGRGQTLSQTGRTELEEAVKQGIVSPEEAFGPGSQWEKWQHADVEAERARRGAQGLPEESEGAALTRYGEVTRATQEANRQRVAEAKFYMAMMPDAAKQFGQVAGGLPSTYRGAGYDLGGDPTGGGVFGGFPSGAGAPGGAISSEDLAATQFMSYLQKPEGKQALSEYEMRMGEEFGGLYPAYKQAYLKEKPFIAPGTTPGVDTIEAWLAGSAPPEAKDYWKRFSGARAQRLGRRGGETIL